MRKKKRTTKTRSSWLVNGFNVQQKGGGGGEREGEKKRKKQLFLAL